VARTVVVVSRKSRGSWKSLRFNIVIMCCISRDCVLVDIYTVQIRIAKKGPLSSFDCKTSFFFMS